MAAMLHIQVQMAGSPAVGHESNKQGSAFAHSGGLRAAGRSLQLCNRFLKPAVCLTLTSAPPLLRSFFEITPTSCGGREVQIRGPRQCRCAAALPSLPCKFAILQVS
jgi:hypothetical protein